MKCLFGKDYERLRKNDLANEKSNGSVLNLPAYSTLQREISIEMCGWPKTVDMNVLKTISPPDRAVAMAVLHGNMEHAVALLKKLESDTLGEEGGAAETRDPRSRSNAAERARCWRWYKALRGRRALG